MAAVGFLHAELVRFDAIGCEEVSDNLRDAVGGVCEPFSDFGEETFQEAVEIRIRRSSARGCRGIGCRCGARGGIVIGGGREERVAERFNISGTLVVNEDHNGRGLSRKEIFWLNRANNDTNRWIKGTCFHTDAGSRRDSDAVADLHIAIFIGELDGDAAGECNGALADGVLLAKDNTGVCGDDAGEGPCLGSLGTVN